MPIQSNEDKWKWVFDNYQQTPTVAFVQALHNGAENGADTFKEEISECVKADKNANPDLIYSQIYLEYLYFLLALLDRFAFSELGEEAGGKFMNHIGMLCFVDAGNTLFNETSQKLVVKMGDGYNDALKAYYPYQTMLAPKDKPMSDEGLSPQLGLRICKILKLDPSDVMSRFKVNFTTYSPIVSFEVLVDFSEWAKGPIMEMGLKNYESIMLVDEEKQKRIEKLNEDFKVKD